VPQWCQREESEELKRKAKPGQLESLSIKVDPQMKAALEKAARDEFTSVSSILKKAAAVYLQQIGIEWREETSSKK
jgi:hypothetical protein